MSLETLRQINNRIRSAMPSKNKGGTPEFDEMLYQQLTAALTQMRVTVASINASQRTMGKVDKDIKAARKAQDQTNLDRLQSERRSLERIAEFKKVGRFEELSKRVFERDKFTGAQTASLFDEIRSVSADLKNLSGKKYADLGNTINALRETFSDRRLKEETRTSVVKGMSDFIKKNDVFSQRDELIKLFESVKQDEDGKLSAESTRTVNAALARMAKEIEGLNTVRDLVADDKKVNIQSAEKMVALLEKNDRFIDEIGEVKKVLSDKGGEPLRRHRELINAVHGIRNKVQEEKLVYSLDDLNSTLDTSIMNQREMEETLQRNGLEKQVRERPEITMGGATKGLLSTLIGGLIQMGPDGAGQLDAATGFSDWAGSSLSTAGAGLVGAKYAGWKSSRAAAKAARAAGEVAPAGGGLIRGMLRGGGNLLRGGGGKWGLLAKLGIGAAGAAGIGAASSASAAPVAAALPTVTGATGAVEGAAGAAGIGAASSASAAPVAAALPTVTGATGAVEGAAGATSGAARGAGRVGGMMSRIPKGARVGGVLSLGLGALEYSQAENDDQRHQAIGGAAGGMAGAWAGGEAGMAAGAGIGALFGGVGAVPGAAIGGILGALLGGFGGDAIGRSLASGTSEDDNHGQPVAAGGEVSMGNEMAVTINLLNGSSLVERIKNGGSVDVPLGGETAVEKSKRLAVEANGGVDTTINPVDHMEAPGLLERIGSLFDPTSTKFAGGIFGGAVASPGAGDSASYAVGEQAAPTGSTAQHMKTIYDAYRKAGLTHEGATTMVAQIGRENGFQEKYLFGTHRDDANGAVNAGMFSWQKDRGQRMLKYLGDRGLLDSKGNIQRSEGALAAQAEFSVQELRTNKQYAPSLQALTDPNQTYGQQEKTVGMNYVGWRYNDPRYHADGLRNQNTYEQRARALHLDRPTVGRASAAPSSMPTAPAAQWSAASGGRGFPYATGYPMDGASASTGVLVAGRGPRASTPPPRPAAAPVQSRPSILALPKPQFRVEDYGLAFTNSLLFNR